MKPTNSTARAFGRWLRDWLSVGLIRGLLLLPYRIRIPLTGWILAYVVAPLAGYRDRVRKNLALVFPQMPKGEVERLVRAVPDNIGRTLIEIWSGDDFKRHVARTPLRGAGAAALQEALQDGRGVILVSGHFGNYDVLRARLAADGHMVGGLYRPFASPRLDRPYRKAIAGIGGPIFPRGRRGLAEMVRHLRDGGLVGILIDQHMSHGAPLKFFGRTAMTAVSAAEMALKYNALLVPVYGVRQPDGINFELLVEAPVPPSTPEIMTQARNDSRERQVRAHMDQWLWVHRRWKGARAG
ncbi:MAG: lysophospholipid acyltransferase family protein [Pseudorhodobacter sp.]|nr:lysophospholipid acyltransferase family protein [Pseudorhodobacter sp.]